MRTLVAALSSVILLAAPLAAEEEPQVRWVLGSEHLRVLYWPEHDDLAHLARDVGEQALVRLSGLLDAEPPQRIEVFIVSSQAEFDQLTGSERASLTLGRALLNQDRVVVKPMGPQRLPKLLVHELAHIVLDARMGAAGGNVPRWLHEGIAKYASEDWSDAEARIVARAALAEELLELDELDAAFEGKVQQVALAYAQSYTLTVYLASLRPGVGVGPLLDQVARGRDIRTALARAYGLPVPQIEKEWLEQTRTAYLPELMPVPSELIVGGAFVVAFALAVIFARRRSARIRQRMEEEERLRELLTGSPAPSEEAEAPGSASVGPAEQ